MPRRDTSWEMRRRAGNFWPIVVVTLLGVLVLGMGAMAAADAVVSFFTGRPVHVDWGEVVGAFMDSGQAGSVLEAGPTWSVWSVFALLIGAVTWLFVALVRGQRRRLAAVAADVSKQKGLPDRATVRKHYGARQVMRRAASIRPDLVGERKRKR